MDTSQPTVAGIDEQEGRNDPSANRDKAHQNRLKTLLDAVTAVRETVLIFAGISYLVGYVIWSFYAQNHNLGQLPLLQSQYLIAGAIPVIIVAVGVAAVYTMFAFSRYIGTWIGLLGLASSRRTKMVILTLYGVAFSIALVLCLTQKWRPLWNATFGIWAFWLTCFVSAGFPLAIRLLFAQETTKLTYTKFDWLVSGVCPAFFGWACIHTYCQITFPMWPQSLGGALPRVATLDVVLADLPTSSLANLVPLPMNKTAKIVRTNQVYVYFSSNQATLTKAFPDPSAETFEIPTSSIKGITWYPDGIPYRALAHRKP